jgi:hypothetical protein
LKKNSPSPEIMQPVLHCILSSTKNVIRENETRNDEAPTKNIEKKTRKRK